MQTTQQKTRATHSHLNSTPQSKLLKIEREFKAPVDRLFDAFTTAEAIKVWWWPKNLYADRVDYDFREGGLYLINMKGLDKGGGGMVGQFEEIIENKRIVMSDRFADENGKPISAEEAKVEGVWPELIYITLEFSSNGENASQLNLSQQGVPNEMQKDCIQGWNESFDKLKKYLETT